MQHNSRKANAVSERNFLQQLRPLARFKNQWLDVESADTAISSKKIDLVLVRQNGKLPILNIAIETVEGVIKHIAYWGYAVIPAPGLTKTFITLTAIGSFTGRTEKHMVIIVGHRQYFGSQEMSQVDLPGLQDRRSSTAPGILYYLAPYIPRYSPITRNEPAVIIVGIKIYTLTNRP
jgi:hypothetical protein